MHNRITSRLSGRREEPRELEAEFGDILFSLVNAARHIGIDAEMALRSANTKFVGRFNRMEELARERGLELSSLPLEEQDALWNLTKSQE